MSILDECKVIKNDQITNEYFDMTILAPNIAEITKPGQFLHIKCGHSTTLRRPISICDVFDSHIRIVYELRGRGTKWLSHRKTGDLIDILGPLGNGVYPTFDTNEKILLAGGGVGAAPLLYAAKKCGKADAVLGFRTAAGAILIDDFYASCENLLIATDDGTLGAHGTVGKPLEILLDKNHYTAILSCGPKPMLKAIANIAAVREIPCYVSMEERMACGVGACLGCACKTFDSSHNTGFSHVCKDGPVFDASRVIWE